MPLLGLIRIGFFIVEMNNAVMNVYNRNSCIQRPNVKYVTAMNDIFSLEFTAILLQI